MSAYTDLILTTIPARHAASSVAMYLRLNETGGTNANDSGANNQDGTYTGGYILNNAPLISDVDAKSVYCDGTNGNITLGANPGALINAAAKVSWAMWVKFPSTPAENDHVFAIGQGTAAGIYSAVVTTGTVIVFGARDASGQTAKAPGAALPTGYVGKPLLIGGAVDFANDLMKVFIRGLGSTASGESSEAFSGSSYAHTAESAGVSAIGRKFQTSGVTYTDLYANDFVLYKDAYLTATDFDDMFQLGCAKFDNFKRPRRTTGLYSIPHLGL